MTITILDVSVGTDEAIRPFPVGVSQADVLPRELDQAARSWAEQAYPKLVHFTELPEGNHFAARRQGGRS